MVWDEDNLIYNESNKSATMKIDEPPTPYNKEYDSAEDDEEESTSSSEKEKGSKSDDDGERTSSATRRNHREDIKTEEAARAHFDQVSTALEESKLRPARTARPRFSSDEDTTEDDEGAEHGTGRPISLLLPSPGLVGVRRRSAESQLILSCYMNSPLFARLLSLRAVVVVGGARGRLICGLT